MREQIGFIAVDDTDDLTKNTSTGKIARLIADEVSALGGFVHYGVTRHQLLVADSVPYTSHNSTMAFSCILDVGKYSELRARAISVLMQNRAETSDPGLCIATPPENHFTYGRPWGEDASSARELVLFGRRAQAEFCSKESAYDVAGKYPWVSLSEHGGTGMGVVGALAGVGLRIEGMSGRFRGVWDLTELRIRSDAFSAMLTVRSVCECLERQLNGSVRVVDGAGEAIPFDLPMELASRVKPILYRNEFTIVAEIVNGTARPCEKADLDSIGNGSDGWSQSCSLFDWDNDCNECIDTSPSCRNCLYRRWIPDGFACMREARY